MFDPRDLSSDPRTRTPQRPKRDYLERAPGPDDAPGAGPSLIRDPPARVSRVRTERAVAEIGMYRTRGLQGSIGGAF